MATSKVLQEYGTQLLFADHATDFGAAPATVANSLIIGAPTDVQMNMSVIADAAYWQSAKTATLADTGTAAPIEWVLGACMEATATPAAGTTYSFWWNSSPSATDGTANSGGTSGTDLAYTAAGEDQLILIGQLMNRNTVVNIDAVVGRFSMPYLYGSLIIQNNSGVAMVADADADEIHCVLTPIITHIQAAV